MNLLPLQLKTIKTHRTCALVPQFGSPRAQHQWSSSFLPLPLPLPSNKRPHRLGRAKGLAIIQAHVNALPCCRGPTLLAWPRFPNLSSKLGNEPYRRKSQICPIMQPLTVFVMTVFFWFSFGFGTRPSPRGHPSKNHGGSRLR